MKSKFYNKLSFKLIASIFIVFLLNILLYYLYAIPKLENDLSNAISQNAYNISDLIKKSTRYGMLRNQNYDVHQIINTIGTEEGVEKIRIYNKQGSIIFSTDSTEILKSVDMNAEACVACHNEGIIREDLTEKERVRTFINNDGNKVIGLINPIKNEVDCYTSECHAHDASTEILGVLDVVLSLEKTDAIIESNGRSLILSSAIITLFLTLFAGIFIALLINRPIKKIREGIDEISEGNLNYKIRLNSDDELGIVAQQFNEMSVKLNNAYTEIKDWNETLNNKVNEKTEELKNVYQQVIQIEKLASLGKLSATVAHELNNPLEGILTYSKLIAKKLKKEQKEDEYQKLIDHLDVISRESARCGRIVKDLLLFSHRGENEFANENLIDIIEKGVILIQHHLDINKIKLVKDFQSMSINICADAQKVQQALLSLLINGIESMNEGGTLKVSALSDGNNAILKIADEGYGISDADLPHIFEPFFTTKEKTKGTGLGLAVAYGIIEQHKGKIELENTSSKGTIFKITLPLCKNNK